MNLWAGPKTGLVLDPPRELKDVEACMNYLRACENFLHIAGRFHDLLAELASLRDGPFPEFPTTAASAARKRSRVDYEQPIERRASQSSVQSASTAQGSTSTQQAGPSTSRARQTQPAAITSAPEISSRRGDSDWQESFLDPHPFRVPGNALHDLSFGDQVPPHMAPPQRQMSLRGQQMAGGASQMSAGASQLSGRGPYTSQDMYTQGSSRGSFVPSDNDFARMTYIQEELAYETGFQYPSHPASQAALPSRMSPGALSNHPLIPPGARMAGEGGRGVGGGGAGGADAEMPFSFPQYPFNMESGFEMPSMADYQAALQDPRLMQGGSLDDTAQGVFALGTNMMSMCDGTSNSFE